MLISTNLIFLDPLVVIPAIYMIGLQGSPLEIIGGLVDTEALLTRTRAALDIHNNQLAVPQTSQVYFNVSLF